MNRYFGVHVLDGEWHALLPRYALLASRVEGKRVLDVGCGTGIGSSLLMELGAERVDGVDYRPKVLELANMKHGKASLNFHRMLLEELSFEDDTFDLALCLDSSHPVTDANLLEEVDRVLRPDGEYVCAIERRTIDGLEQLLPQYGYEEAGESIEIPRRENQAPQIGELQTHFDQVGRVHQRPRLSYRFERTTDDDTDDAESTGDPDVVDARFQDAADESPAVEILFCGPDDAPPPSTGDIQLPYFTLAERLQRLFRDLQRRQSPGESDHQFDEIVDADDQVPSDRQPTQKIDQPFERRETETFRDNVGAQTNEQNAIQNIASQLRDQLSDLSNWYDDLRKNFRSMRRETRETLARQQDRIDELFDQQSPKSSDGDDDLREALDAQADRLASLEDKLTSLAESIEEHEAGDDDSEA